MNITDNTCTSCQTYRVSGYVYIIYLGGYDAFKASNVKTLKNKYTNYIDTYLAYTLLYNTFILYNNVYFVDIIN